jgi:hypothetical protein
MYQGSNGWIRLALAFGALMTIAGFFGDWNQGNLRW